MMDDISNTSIRKRIRKRKKKSTGFSEGKENTSPEMKLEIIERPPSFDFNLGVNSAINRGSPLYKELLLSLKSPKVWNNPQSLISCSSMPCFHISSHMLYLVMCRLKSMMV
jgi:hypothetical protein